MVTSRGLPARRSTSTAARAGLALLSTLAVAGCFDVGQVNPGSANFLIDDFEDGDAVPSTSLFSHWRCLTYNPDTGLDPEQTVTCDVEAPGFQSSHALFAQFSLHDAMPGTLQYAGVSLGSWVDEKPAVDFNGYTALVFYIKVETTDPPPPNEGVDVQLGCNSVKGVDDNSPEIYFDVVQYITPSKTWQRFSALISNFTQRPDEMNHFEGGPRACLALVDSIRFEVNGGFNYGQSASGVIHIDNVHLE